MFVVLRCVCESERESNKKSPSPWYVVGRVKVERVITSCVKHDQSTTGSFLSSPPWVAVEVVAAVPESDGLWQLLGAREERDGG